MPYVVEQKYFGLGKETERGVPVSPTRWLPIHPDTEFDYKVTLIEDELLRGVMERFVPQAGVKEGTGTLTLDLTGRSHGEIFLSLLGDVETAKDTPEIGVHQHKFFKGNKLIHPSYTLFLFRGINAKQYPLSIVKTVVFTGSMDGKVTTTSDILFKTEIDVSPPIPSPTWEDHSPFMFFETEIKLDGVKVNIIRDWTLTIDNGSVVRRTLRGSQDIDDIFTFAKLLVSGGFSIYFEDEIQRKKFLDKTEASLEITLTGRAIPSKTARYMLRIWLPLIHYTAFPFGDLDGFLGSAVTFNAYYKSGVPNSVEIILQNDIASY